MRKGTATMTCLLVARFFFSLSLCFSGIGITGRRDGMGWDGEGIRFRYLGAVCRLPKVRLDLFGVV